VAVAFTRDRHSSPINEVAVNRPRLAPITTGRSPVPIAYPSQATCDAARKSHEETETADALPARQVWIES
jgi:hypothetical protein